MTRLYEIYLSINDFEILAEFNVLHNLHLCAQKSVCATNLGAFGEIGANFSLQLSSRTRFDKFNKKIVIAENQCEKHKTSSFFLVTVFFSTIVNMVIIELYKPRATHMKYIEGK